MKPMTKNVIRLLVTITLVVIAFIVGTIEGRNLERNRTLDAIQYICMNEQVIFKVPSKGTIQTFTCIYSGPENQPLPSKHLPNRAMP